MMEILVPLLENPITQGLALGLVIAGFVGVAGWNKRRGLTKQIQELKVHLHTKMSIDEEGYRALKDELQKMKNKNENLRISLAALKNKADKNDLQTLYLYDKAIHLMYEKSPGFAGAWEVMLQEAQIELDKTNTGLTAWVRRKVRPSLAAGNPKRALPSGDEDSDVEFIVEKKRKRLKR
jgi:hypothetical protein